MLVRVKRQQAVQGLLDCFQHKDHRLRKKVFHIDRSFKHSELDILGDAEKSIFNQTVDDFVEKERKQVQEKQKQEDREQFAFREVLIRQYRRQDLSKTVHILNHPKKIKMQSPQIKIKQKNIIIERKYNTQLSYQLHSIVQAKKIEEASHKIMMNINKLQQSPLVNNLSKLIQKHLLQTSLSSRQTKYCPKTSINKLKPTASSQRLAIQDNRLIQMRQPYNASCNMISKSSFT